MITEADCLREIRRLEVVYGDQDRADDLARAWHKALGRISAASLIAAVERYIGQPGARYFPRPWQIKALAAEVGTASGDYVAQLSWNQLQEGPCPVCGAVLQLVTDPLAQRYVWDPGRRPSWRKREKSDPQPEKRYGVLHDREAHERAGVPIVGGAR